MPATQEVPTQTQAQVETREARRAGPDSSLLESVLSVRPRKAMVDIKNTTVAVLDGREIVVGVKDNLARSFGIRMGPGSMENKSERIAWNLGNRTKEAVAPTMYFMAGKTGLSDEVLAQAVLAQAEGLDIATATRERTPEGEQKDVVFLFYPDSSPTSSKMLRVELPAEGEELNKEETIASARKALEVEEVRASIKKNDSQAQVIKIGQSEDGKTLVGGEGWTVELPVSGNVIDGDGEVKAKEAEEISYLNVLIKKDPMLALQYLFSSLFQSLDDDFNTFADGIVKLIEANKKSSSNENVLFDKSELPTENVQKDPVIGDLETAVIASAILTTDRGSVEHHIDNSADGGEQLQSVPADIDGPQDSSGVSVEEGGQISEAETLAEEPEGPALDDVSDVQVDGHVTESVDSGLGLDSGDGDLTDLADAATS